MVYVLLAEGFEEVEALTPVDLLRRAGVETRLVGVTGATVCGARGINVVTDLSMDEVDLVKADMLVLPGGMPGTAHLRADERVCDLVREFAATKHVAAICTRTSASPMRFARWQMQASTLRPSARLRPSFWAAWVCSRARKPLAIRAWRTA